MMKRFFCFAVVAWVLSLVPYVGIAQPQAVDLGLSVKWASCNLGATSPAGHGNHYSWGEKKAKREYFMDSYKKFRNGNCFSITEYNYDKSYGPVDNKSVLDASDDAAHAKLGGSWRIPTYEEWTELRNSCTWTWTTQDGTGGYRVTSKKNGNSIFLPAAGRRQGADLDDAGSDGSYWSSSLSSQSPDRAWGVYFYGASITIIPDYRFLGFSIRPVTE